jgi:CMP/dCMP kinase
MKKQIITIAGKPGSGKSCTSKASAAELGFGHFSSGDLMRELGSKRGLDILDTNKVAESDTELDRQVDEKLIDIGKSSSELVIDSRMAWHWIPDSLKIYLDLDLLTAATRIINDSDEERRAKENIPDDPEEYAEQLQQRLTSESYRYWTKYGVDPYNSKNYDLVVDTASASKNDVVARVVGGYTLWITN